jgi:hypothetical protein
MQPAGRFAHLQAMCAAVAWYPVRPAPLLVRNPENGRVGLIARSWCERIHRAPVMLLCVIFISSPVLAQDQATVLAKQLSNPVAALISVPFQLNFDQDIGPADEGERWTLNVQPVVPIGLNDDWNLISRTILPVVAQDDIFPGAGSQSGIGDVV